MDIVKALELMLKGYENIGSGSLDPEYGPDACAAYFVIKEAIKEIERLRGNFKEKVIKLMDAFVDATGKQPTKIYVPKIIETDILRLTYDDIGPLINNVNEKGSREAFEKIFGMEVVWDAEEFRVERIKKPVEDKKEEVQDGEDEG